MNNPLLFDPVDLMTNQALTVSGGATPSVTSSRLLVARLSKINLFVKNAAASTSVTVTIYGSDTSTGLNKSALAVFTLGAGTTGSPYTAGRYIERDAVPRYIYAVATNSDAANVASISVTLDRWR